MKEPIIIRKNKAKTSEPRIEEREGKTVKVYIDENNNKDDIFSLLNDFSEEDEEKEEKTLELKELLSGLKLNIKQLYPYFIWVKGEISGWKKNGKHIYFDLVQRDKTGRIEAKINAKLWESNISKVLFGFKRKTNEDLKDGMNCEWLVSFDYHENFGFSVTIQDVKPLWTVGEHEKKQALIRDKLKKEGLWDRQKAYNIPNIITRLAIISPDGAAGLGDFKSEADRWSNNNVMYIDYKSAIFEGDKAKDSVSSALKYFSNIQNNESLPNYDLLIILRGGGAKASLAWLDEYDISKEICLFNGPVWTAIGHEQDSGILDEVSNLSIHTPSKAAQKIWDLLNAEYQLINDFNNNFKREYSYKIENVQNNIENMISNIKKSSISKIENLDIKIDSIISKIKTNSKNKLFNFEKNKEQLLKNIVGLSPRETLKRGYAIVTDEKGKVIKSAKDIKKKNIRVEWESDSITIKNKDIIINKKEEEENE